MILIRAYDLEVRAFVLEGDDTVDAARCVGEVIRINKKRVIVLRNQ
jgi:hypothetical protein